MNTITSKKLIDKPREEKQFYKFFVCKLNSIKNDEWKGFKHLSPPVVSFLDLHILLYRCYCNYVMMLKR